MRPPLECGGRFIVPAVDLAKNLILLNSIIKN
jgi:hypothetical protein